MHPCLAALLTGLSLSLPFPALADALDDGATAMFSAAFHETCLSALREDGTLVEPPKRYATTMASSYGDPEEAVVWQFRCDVGAYNLASVFLVHTRSYGTRPLALPMPELAVRNEEPDNFESAVLDISVSGWTAEFRAINATFDAARGEISTIGYWRGLGDAYSASVFVLRDDTAGLLHYEADASYDGKVEPQFTLDFR